MNRYELFDVDDLISDEYFIEWVLNPQPEHHAFWEDWQLKNPQHITKLNSAKRIISALAIRPVEEELSIVETDQILSTVQKRIIGKETSSLYFLTNLRIWAAAILAIAITGFWLYNDSHKNDDNINQQQLVISDLKEYKNSSNQSKLIRFTDGSLAILKPKSTLRYPATFKGDTRTVYLEGEAFFEVQKNPKKPFFVYSDDMITQVVGTSFTVKAFGGADEFKVIVNTGKVKVYHNDQAINKSSKIITLIPHQQAIYKRNITLIKKDTIQSKLLLSEEVANQTFTLNKVTLTEIIFKLEEAYGVQINYNKEQLGQLTLTAQLANLPLDQKVELVCKAINATCKFSNGEIYIYHQSSTNQINN